MLTKNEILAAIDRRPVEVAAPGLGGAVYVRPWSVGEVATLIALYDEHDKAEHVLLDLVFSLCDSDGNLLFELADLATLRQMPMAALAPVSAAIQRLNGAGQQDAIEKN